MNERSLSQYVDVARACGVAVGLETEILESGEVAIDDSERAKVDYLIGGLHTMHGIRFFDDRTVISDPHAYVRSLRDALIKAAANGHIDALAHPTKIPETLHGQEQELVTAEWRAPLIDAAARYGVAFDVNEDSRVPDVAFVRDCREAGVRMLIGSDAHVLADARRLQWVERICSSAGLGERDLYVPEARPGRR